MVTVEIVVAIAGVIALVITAAAITYSILDDKEDERRKKDSLTQLKQEIKRLKRKANK